MDIGRDDCLGDKMRSKVKDKRIGGLVFSVYKRKKMLKFINLSFYDDFNKNFLNTLDLSRS